MIALTAALALLAAGTWVGFLLDRPRFLEAMIDAELVGILRVQRELRDRADRGEIDRESDFYVYFHDLARVLGHARASDVPGPLAMRLSPAAEDPERDALADRAWRQARDEYIDHARLALDINAHIDRAYRYRSTMVWVVEHTARAWLALLQVLLPVGDMVEWTTFAAETLARRLTQGARLDDPPAASAA